MSSLDIAEILSTRKLSELNPDFVIYNRKEMFVNLKPDLDSQKKFSSTCTPPKQVISTFIFSVFIL